MKLGRNGFCAYDLSAAAPEALPDLERTTEKIGFLPNLLRFMAESPSTLRGYRSLDDIFFSGTLTKQECLVVQLAASVENGCRYCIAAHSTQSLQQGIDSNVVDALRSGSAAPDARLAGLADMVRALIRHRGAVDEAQVAAFFEAGFTHAQLLEVVLGIAVKTISNYTNHLVDSPLDEAFASQRVDSKI